MINIRPVKFINESIVSNKEGIANHSGLTLFRSWAAFATGSLYSYTFRTRKRLASPRKRKRFIIRGCLKSVNIIFYSLPSSPSATNV